MVSEHREQAPARGRPKDPAKQEALLHAARTLFLKHGLDTTMEQVVTESRVSRTTLYANFPDKGSLIEAMFARESQRIVSEEFATSSLSLGIEEALIGFGERLVRFLSDPEMIAFERLIPLVADAYPDLASRFFAAGPGRAKGILLRIIEQARDRGDLVVDDLDEAVSDLVGLWQGFRRVEQAFGQNTGFAGDDLNRHVRRVVMQFMRLYGVSSQN